MNARLKFGPAATKAPQAFDAAASIHERSSRARARAPAPPSAIALLPGNFGSIAVALAALFLAGCDTSPQRGDYPVEPERPGERRMQFTCRDGEQVAMHMVEARGGFTFLTYRGRTLKLKEQSTESGVIYSDGANTVRRKGRDLRLDLAGREPVECRSQSE